MKNRYFAITNRYSWNINIFQRSLNNKIFEFLLFSCNSIVITSYIKSLIEMQTQSMTFCFLQKNRKNPPLQRNQNKFSGAVIWQRLLLDKLKKSVIAFRSVSHGIIFAIVLGLHFKMRFASQTILFSFLDLSLVLRRRLMKTTTRSGVSWRGLPSTSTSPSPRRWRPSRRKRSRSFCTKAPTSSTTSWSATFWS